MTWIHTHLLTLLVFTPLLGAGILACVPNGKSTLIKGCAFFASLFPLIVSLFLVSKFDPHAGLQFSETTAWIAAWNSFYRVGIDGTSLALILLTTSLFPLILANTRVSKGLKPFLILLLILECATLGAFVSLDLLLFYVFWEIVLIPIFFLIGIWGGPRRSRTVIKFFIFTMAGSLALLLGIAFLYHYSRGSFNLLELSKLDLPLGLARLLFAAFALAFLIKTPIFLLHTWSPDTYAEAPTSASIVLAALLSKLGVYGIIRFCLPLFGAVIADWQTPLMLLSTAGIVYASLLAWVQTDAKRLIAYSSMAHMGVILLGVFSLNEKALSGVLVYLVSHGLSTAALFFGVGAIARVCGKHPIDAYGGLSTRLAPLAVFFFVAVLSTIGLPGTSGFVGEILVLIGSFEGHPALAIVASSAVILSAVYMLRFYQALFFGPRPVAAPIDTHSFSMRHWLALLPLALAMIGLGLYPRPLLSLGQSLLAASHTTQTVTAPPHGASGVELEKGDSD